MLTICTNIELARPADAAEISGLSRRSIERGLRPRYTPQLVRELMRDKSKNVVVARRRGALLGFGIMTYGRDSANLDLLAVKKPFRQRGVGRQVLQWLEKVALTAAITNVFVQVRISNAAAIRFYEKLGFQVVEQVAGYYQKRETAVILCKGIRPVVGYLPRARLRVDGPTET